MERRHFQPGSVAGVKKKRFFEILLENNSKISKKGGSRSGWRPLLTDIRERDVFFFRTISGGALFGPF
jgi:hypothetical protein